MCLLRNAVIIWQGPLSNQLYPHVSRKNTNLLVISSWKKLEKKCKADIILWDNDTNIYCYQLPKLADIFLIFIHKWGEWLWYLTRWKWEYPAKTNDMSQVTDKRFIWSHIVISTTWTGLEFATLVMIGTDWIGSCKSSYHTTTTARIYKNKITWYITNLYIKYTCTARWVIFLLLYRLLFLMPKVILTVNIVCLGWMCKVCG